MTRRFPVLIATLLALLLAGRAEAAPACTCREGQACWHYLRSPVPPPDDPCSCAHCREVARHTGEAPWPEEWSRVRMSSKQDRLDAFLRRHAASWQLVCSACDRTRVPGVENPEDYPFTPASGKRWYPRALEMIRKQLAVEKDLLPYTPVVIESPHFYLVLDIPKMRVPIQGRSRNTTRVAEMHELAHIYIERLEKGYREFCEVFGPPTLRRPVGVYMPESSAVASVIQETYFGHPDTTILLGGGSSTISGDHCMCGFSAGLHRQKLPSKPRNEGFALKWRGGRKAAPLGHFVRLMDDDQVHLRVRHLLAHTLLAAWPTVNVKPESLRPWLYVGVGHWLAKRHPRLHELATYCGEECKPLSNSGKKWDEKAMRLAGDSGRDPVQAMCAANTLPEINTFPLHLRAWSWFEVFLEHDRERFVAFVRALRAATPAPDAAPARMGCSLEELDRRWADLVRGRRPDEGGEPEDEDDIARAVRKAVAAAKRAAAPKDRAALVKNLPAEAVARLPEELVAFLGDRSPHVRETAVLKLVRSKAPGLDAFLRTTGVDVGSPLALANVVRVLGLRKDADAADPCLELLEHGHWLVRANAARTLARLGAPGAGEAVLARLAGESAPRTRIALVDALAELMTGRAEPVPAIAEHLGASEWQVRAAAARALGRIGLLDAVPDLIARMEADGGRIREECRDALKAITHDDLGSDPRHWRRWWEKRRGDAPPAPAAREPGAEEHHPTGTIDRDEPTYYGLRVVSGRVGYVLDLSQSMTTIFRPTESLQRRLRRSAEPRPRIEHARDELIDSVTGLDPRTVFNIWTFHEVIAAWNPNPVVANATNRSRAVQFLRGLEPGEATNYYDALRAVLGLPEEGLPSAGFRPTPDTIFFLTDGEPTVGEITDADELIGWWEEENRFARLRVNVIAFGDKNLNFDLLSAMTRGSGGTLVHLREK